MKIIIDMSLSPRWVPVLASEGFEVVHWSEVGVPDAPDREIMAWALDKGYVVFTHDLDFTALLAATQAVGPSVIQVRAQDVMPERMGVVVIQSLRQFEQELEAGALVSVDPGRARVRILPFGT